MGKKYKSISKVLLMWVLTLIISSGNMLQCLATSGLIFHSGFEAGSVGNDPNVMTDITGTDNSVSAPNNWVTDMDGYSKFGNFVFEYEAGTVKERYATLFVK